ncbi:MAG: glycosyltransferase [Pseudomonadota bacterium]
MSTWSEEAHGREKPDPASPGVSDERTAASDDRPRLLFVSPQFLFPMDAGGKIRTANILKNLKNGAFQIDLISPAPAVKGRTQGHGDPSSDLLEKWRPALSEICDTFHAWPGPASGPIARARRVAGLLTPLPVSIWTDATGAARAAVADAVRKGPDLIIYDYIHSLALRPTGATPAASIGAETPTIVFTHNLETEIFRRHRDLAEGPMRLLYAAEAAKMARFEGAGVRAVDGVIAVSEKDASAFKDQFDASDVQAIPTGVDLEFFSFESPADDADPIVTFTGSMDWRANQEGLSWFLHEVWPHIAAARPDAAFRVIGKNPPPGLVKAAKDAGANWTFTGFVDDIRDHARGAAYVIPIRAGSGTRIKAFEAMAMGAPVVSTTVGVEGLELTPVEHYLNADDPQAFAVAVVRLLNEPEMRNDLAQRARARVEARQSQAAAAAVFEAYCLRILKGRG